MQAALESGKDIPESLLDTPELSAWNIFFWNAFVELNSCRGEGMIPWWAIDQYSRRYHVDEDIFEDLVEIIMALDDVIIKHREKERAKK